MVNCILVFCSLRRGFNNIWERQRASKLVGLEHLFLLRGGSEMNWTGWPKNTSAVAMIQSNPWFRTCDFGIRPRKHQGSANSHGRIRLQQVTLAWYDISETMMVYMWHVVYMWIYALITSTTHETMRPFQRGDEHPSPFQLFLGAGLWPIPIVSKIHSETDFASDVQYCHMDADVILFIHKHIYMCVCARSIYLLICVCCRNCSTWSKWLWEGWVTGSPFCCFVIWPIFWGAAKDQLPSLFFFRLQGPQGPPGRRIAAMPWVLTAMLQLRSSSKRGHVTPSPLFILDPHHDWAKYDQIQYHTIY